MSDFLIFGLGLLALCALVILLFKKPISGLLDRAVSAKFEVTPKSLKMSASSRDANRELARDSSVLAESVKDANPGTVKPTASQQALPEDSLQQSETENIETPSTTRELLSIGADWAGLMSDAQKIVENYRISEPEDEASLSEVLQAIDDSCPGILPEKAVKLAEKAAEVLQQFMATSPGEVTHEDARLFNITLSSLHVILSKTASKLRHPSNSRYWVER